MDNSKPMAVGKMVADLERQQFFGSLEIKFEGGRIVYLRKSETLKLSDDCRDDRGLDVHQNS